MILLRERFSLPNVGALIFVGGGGDSEVEQMVSRGQQASALDTIERLLATGLCDLIVVSTDSLAFARELCHYPVQLELTLGEFHFGRQLRSLIEKYRIQRPFYFGGGSAPLLSQADLERILAQLLSLDAGVIANNYYSSDFLAFHPADALDLVALPAIDNDLAFLLVNRAGLPNRPLPWSAATQMDIDTPADLGVLALHPGVGSHLREYVRSLELGLDRLEAAMKCLVDQNAEVLVAGRISSQTWSYLEKEAACRKRVFSEERGMRASGREARGEVVSLLGLHLEAVGPCSFFQSLASLGQAAILDTRVIFRHLKLDPPPADRFHADLLQPEAISDPRLREFTRAAREAPIPLVLGGHSIVSGGLVALVEAAWARFDPKGRVCPQQAL